MFFDSAQEAAAGRRWEVQESHFTPPTSPSEQVASITKRRSNHATAVLNGHLYAIGGSLPRSMESLNLTSGVWRPRQRMPELLANSAAAGFNGSLWLCGGSWVPLLRNCYVYSPSTNSWQRGPRMQSGRAEFGLLVLAGQLYAVGGDGLKRQVSELWRNEPDYRTVERLHPDTGDWQLLPGFLSRPANRASVVAL